MKRKQHVAGVVCLLVLIALVVGCGLLDGRSWTTQDSWYRPVPEGVGRGREMSREKVVVVSAREELAAEKRLAAVSFVAVTAEEASALTGKALTPGHWYLVRGVMLNEGTGAFGVNQLPGGDIEVAHGSLGRRPVPMTRRAVVVELENAPREVYVDCDMAE